MGVVWRDDGSRSDGVSDWSLSGFFVLVVGCMECVCREGVMSYGWQMGDGCGGLSEGVLGRVCPDRSRVAAEGSNENDTLQ